jgi:hypothetical protein
LIGCGTKKTDGNPEKAKFTIYHQFFRVPLTAAFLGAERLDSMPELFGNTAADDRLGASIWGIETAGAFDTKVSCGGGKPLVFLAWLSK